MTTDTDLRSPLLTVLRRAGSRGLFALTLLGAVAEHGAAVAAAAAGGWVVGAAVEGRPAGDLGPGLALLVGGVVVAAAAQWLDLQAAHAFAWRHQATLRGQVFDGVSRSAPRPIDEMSTGEVASVAMADVEQLEGFFAHLAPAAVAAAVTVVGSTVALCVVGPAFAVLFLVAAVVVATVPSVLAVRSAARGEALRTGVGRLNSTVVDGVTGMRELVLLGRVDDWTARIAERTRDHDRLLAGQARADGILKATTDLVVSASVVAALVLAISRAADGSLGLAAATAAVVLVIAALRPVVEATGMAANLAPLRASARRVLRIVDHPDPVPDTASGPVPIDPNDASVVFAGVTFGYDDGAPVLDGVDLRVEPGEMVALVGASGAGKTTCANLLLRFWDVDAGAIGIGGHDLRSIPRAQLRSLVSVVPQQVDLFAGTVAANLRIGAPDASAADLERAARAAQAHEFISALPEGYATEVGEDGARLSGGQRQRLAIARALLHDAPVLVLDEAASNLDTENERAVHAAIRALRGSRTTLVVAHRLSTIRSADRIVVLDGGRVVEDGPHDALVAADGPYARLVAHQHDGLVGA